MDKDRLKSLESIFQAYPEIKPAYFFGSRAKAEEGPLSDYDFFASKVSFVEGVTHDQSFSH